MQAFLEVVKIVKWSEQFCMERFDQLGFGSNQFARFSIRIYSFFWSLATWRKIGFIETQIFKGKL